METYMYTTEDTLELMNHIKYALVHTFQKPIPQHSFVADEVENFKQFLNDQASKNECEFPCLLIEIFNTFNKDSNIEDLKTYIRLWTKHKNLKGAEYLLDVLDLTIDLYFDKISKDTFDKTLNALAPINVKKDSKFRDILKNFKY